MSSSGLPLSAEGRASLLPATAFSRLWSHKRVKQFDTKFTDHSNIAQSGGDVSNVAFDFRNAIRH
jgi:hypothetical protein